MKTFIEEVLADRARLDAVDDWVSAWHDADTDASLEEYLGLSGEEYALWAESPAFLSTIVELRRANGGSASGATDSVVHTIREVALNIRIPA